ncbi:MAG TPA: hypothetical protein VNA04_09280 [Thermoanaerobaculia bacterium]|nr:hypothetical protein [Thermoanaerobaculia bacterium]
MDPFSHDRYELRRKFFSPIHTDFTILRPDGHLLLYGRKKGFKLKEDIRLYADEQRQREVLIIEARSVIDLSASYDVSTAERTRIGVLRRKGVRSILRDEWHILDMNEQPIAVVQEDSQARALLRRLLTNLVPQSFHITMGGSPVGEVKQNFNPFLLRLAVDFSLDSRRALDRRLGLAAAALLGTIEGRQG